MGIIYDMASGRIQSPPAQHTTADPGDEIMLRLAVREPLSASAEEKPQAHAIHLIRALLSKD